VRARVDLRAANGRSVSHFFNFALLGCGKPLIRARMSIGGAFNGARKSASPTDAQFYVL
jgi:hypothetical protein